MPFQGRPYDEVFADYDEVEKTIVAPLGAELCEARQVIQALARLIAGWEHLPAVPAELQKRAEKFGADWSG